MPSPPRRRCCAISSAWPDAGFLVRAGGIRYNDCSGFDPWPRRRVNQSRRPERGRQGDRLDGCRTTVELCGVHQLFDHG